jgi:predicted amidohydrolase
MSLRVACIQFTAGPHWARHREQVSELIRSAAQSGATLIATPENTGGMQANKAEMIANAPLEAEHPAVADLCALARELSVTLLCGSLAVRQNKGDPRPYNRSLLIGPQGQILARYDKIHLFDVTLPDGTSYRESENIAPGDQAVLTQVGPLRLGLSICYDLRFAALYRLLAQAGAECLAIPAAFTVPTGEAHWHTLLRARAIENGAYVLAPAQTGTHEGGRQTYGHSLMIDPWGRILADAGTNPGVIIADLHPEEVAKARANLPSLRHDRPFSLLVGNNA